MQARKTDQCFAIRPEARAREFKVVARLILSKKKPKGNRICAARKSEAKSIKVLKSQF